MKHWYVIDNAEKIDSPALLVFPERVKQNIYTAISMVGDVNKLRPHIKTNKSPCVVQLMQEAGINKFKCATIAEAEMLGMVWAKDLLLAYQPTGPKLRRFIELIKNYPKTSFSCLVDNIEAARSIIKAIEEEGINLAVYIDVNVGMNRTGIEPAGVPELIKVLAASKNISRVGLHVYDGHIRNPDPIKKAKEVDTCFEQVKTLQQEIMIPGLDMAPVIVGGSPAFSVHCKRKNVECSPGTFVYWDKSYLDNCPEQDFLPAAVLLTRVISKPNKELLTVDLGHKSIASESGLDRRIFFLDDPGLVPQSHSEEHLVLSNESGIDYKVGDVLYGIPYHICPTVALYEKVLTVENSSCSGEWKNTARDRCIGV